MVLEAFLVSGYTLRSDDRACFGCFSTYKLLCDMQRSVKHLLKYNLKPTGDDDDV